MKVELNQNLVLKLAFSEKPTEITNGKISRTEPNETAYIITDSHREAPIGFGVKVGKLKKTYIVQRRVDGKLIKSKVGNVSDFPTIDSARQKARGFVQIAMETGRNPTTIAKERVAAEITLAEAFDDYKTHLIDREEPATANTIKALGKARRKLDVWMEKRVRDLKTKDILGRFDEIAATTRTTAEQTFRWAKVAVAHAIEIELLSAASEKREPTLVYNPFLILTVGKKFRSRTTLDAVYEAKGVRNPLDAKDSLGRFLDALWARRKQPLNRTGCDYLLTSLIFGNRKSESAQLQWRDRLTEAEAAESSFVDFKNGIVIFRDTKNRSDHRLPIPPFAMELLKQRREMAEDGERGKWVFPARSRLSEKGHYSDSSELLDGIRESAGIAKLTMHDLRRTFGRLVDDLGVPYFAMKRLLNHGVLSDPTSFYASTEWTRLGEHLARAEDALLRTSPTVYNSLRPLNTPPIP